MVVEYPPHTRLLIETARGLINTDADCYRPYDLICVNGDFGDVQMATAIRARGVWQALSSQAEVADGIARFRKAAARSGRR